jgi:hypothetical protein
MRCRIRTLGEQSEMAERDIAAIREDLRTRTSTKGDDFTMAVKKETFTDRTKAGRALVFLAAAMKPFTATKPIGTIAGFPISLQRLEARTNLLIHGKHAYQANVSDNPLGTIASVEHSLASIPELLAEREADAQRFAKQRDDLSKQLNQPFEHDEKLAAATRRQQEIVTALDITKNQASAKVGDGTGEAVAKKADLAPPPPSERASRLVAAI